MWVSMSRTEWLTSGRRDEVSKEACEDGGSKCGNKMGQVNRTGMTGQQGEGGGAQEN